MLPELAVCLLGLHPACSPGGALLHGPLLLAAPPGRLLCCSPQESTRATHARPATALSPLLPPLFPCSSEQSRLAELEEQAKSSKKGMWSDGTASHTIRDLKYTIENPRHFVDSMHQKPVNGG